MDTATFRILERLSSSIGEPLSINQLTERIKTNYGTAYYANTYHKLQDLQKEGILKIEPVGNTSNVKLNFQSYQLTDFLAEMELTKKRAFLEQRNELFSFLMDLEKAFSDNCNIKAIALTNPSLNIKLNRIELLLLLKAVPEYQIETIEIYRKLQELGKYNYKLNTLVMTKGDFSELITSDEINPLREVLSEKIVLFNPQAFWVEVKEIAKKTEIRTLRQETKLARIADLDLTFNLNRFGYKEFGQLFVEGKRYCIEYITTAILLQENARLTESTPIILAKNSFNSNLLVFLSQKYETAGKLLGLLKVLNTVKPKQEVTKTIELLETLKAKEIAADQDSVIEKLRLYNAL